MLDVRPEETTVANEIEAQPAFVISQSTWRLLLRVSRQRTRPLRQIRSHRQPITSITDIASTGQVSPPAMFHQNRHRAIFFVPETLREYLTTRRWHPSQKFSPVAPWPGEGSPWTCNGPAPRRLCPGFLRSAVTPGSWHRRLWPIAFGRSCWGPTRHTEQGHEYEEATDGGGPDHLVVTGRGFRAGVWDHTT